MKLQTSLNFIAKCMLLIGAVWLPSQAHATTCDSGADPIIISKNCSDLVVSNAKSAITLDPGITIDGPHGLLIQTTSGNIGTVTVNAGSQIIGTTYSGIDNEGTINVINNSNLIQGVGNGISNFYSIGSVNNSSGAQISGNDQGITNFASASIGSLINSGTISATNNYGVYNLGTINALTNAGTITSGAIGIYNTSTIDTLTNSGAISVGITGSGVGNNGTINTLNNTGNIMAGDLGWGIENYGTIATLNNAYTGSITAGDAADGILNGTGGKISTLTNLGLISSHGIAIENYGTITALNNLGSIVSNSGTGISNGGTINALTNLSGGAITAGDHGAGIVNSGTINTITNYGSITVGDFALGVNNLGTISSLTNNGFITGGVASTGITNYLTGIINTLTNNSSIILGDNGVGISSGGALSSMINNGSIVSGYQGFGIMNGGTNTSLINNGSITVGNEGAGIANYFSIHALTNNSSISAGDNGVGILNYGIINSLNNTGTISAGVGGIGIDNAGTISTLNNGQGGNGSSSATRALTYMGDLPADYNIIINSATHYGQLAVTSAGSPITTFGIYGAPFLTSRTYASVLSGTTLPSVTSSGTYDNMTWSLVANGADTFDLTFVGASLMGTQQSLVNTANSLAPIFTLQNSVLANSFSYDCNVFGANDVCVSAGGRNTAVSAANGLNNTSALLIAAYRPHPNYRIGAYADQNLSVNNAGGTVNLGNNTPLIGLFGAWNERLDGTGTEVKVSAAYGQKNTTVTRQVVGLSEPGSGSSNLTSQGAQITAKYGFGVIENVIVSPYIGMRYTQNNMDGYTEGASSSVTAPLTYAALNTNATTALAGVGVSYKVIPQVTTFASAGVETDTNTANGTYSATGINGLTPVNFNPNLVKTRPTATLGAYYDVEKNQRLGITGIYRQEPFHSVSTTTVMATYTVGL